jgi:4-amino-4-deoxy-L-arabinose transferase-like glycosyltransferase
MLAVRPVPWLPVTPPIAVLVAVAALALAAWAGWWAVRDRAVVLRQLWGGAVVEGLMLVQAAVAGVRHATGTVPAEPAVFWSYVVTQLVLLPAAALWAFAERSRWSSVVLLVAALAVAFLQLRLNQTWGS